jgi:hypothetical protein
MFSKGSFRSLAPGQKFYARVQQVDENGTCLCINAQCIELVESQISKYPHLQRVHDLVSAVEAECRLKGDATPYVLIINQTALLSETNAIAMDTQGSEPFSSRHINSHGILYMVY